MLSDVTATPSVASAPHAPPATAEALVAVNHLVKRYGRFTAVNDVSFTIRRGEIFGLLGPNGAGKTTTLEIIEGLRRADGGQVTVDGLDVRRDRRAVQRRIGVQLQATTLFDALTVRETIHLFGAFYPSARSADDLLREVALEEKASAMPKDLSGGQRQRLALALALVNDPALLLLDEPTTGLDPQSRRLLWETILRLRARGKTIVLTTHFMDEAQTLCDRIAILDGGRIIAQDTPSGLISLLNASATIDCALVPSPGGQPPDSAALRLLPGVSDVQVGAERVRLYSTRIEKTMTALFQYAEARGMSVEQIQVQAPTLEDVFLKLTGRGLRE
ncbi:MAG TPA: ABC transporter ATP-binding protein [Ktedonobacterales bacterium]|nr:ABC transporter ATP-binding protein [Ktedonobacterales bacterium]